MIVPVGEEPPSYEIVKMHWPPLGSIAGKEFKELEQTVCLNVKPVEGVGTELNMMDAPPTLESVSICKDPGVLPKPKLEFEKAAAAGAKLVSNGVTVTKSLTVIFSTAPTSGRDGVSLTEMFSCTLITAGGGGRTVTLAKTVVGSASVSSSVIWKASVKVVALVGVTSRMIVATEPAGKVLRLHVARTPSACWPMQDPGVPAKFWSITDGSS